MADIPTSPPSEDPPSLIEYPSDFPIKVLGPQHPEFAEILTAVVVRHDPVFKPETLEVRASKAGNYVGLTFTVRVESREQLDALYRELSGHPMVKYVL